MSWLDRSEWPKLSRFDVSWHDPKYLGEINVLPVLSELPVLPPVLPRTKLLLVFSNWLVEV